MRRIVLILTILLLPELVAEIHGQLSLNYRDNRTPTWDETIAMYRQLDKKYPEAKLIEAGMSDSGKPLHLFIISGDKKFEPAQIHKSGKRILFINNGIHPGEPCGVDASLQLAEDLLSKRDSVSSLLDHTVVCIVPLFNIGGALNRSPYNRANQNGPEEHGFRANALNLDLNRDFIKLDSRNARSLVGLIQEWKPDVFIDTHTSNGADYPYVLTLIASHPQKMEASMGTFQQEVMLPWLYAAMHRGPYEMIPYVANFSESPDQGIEGFMDYPRYTTGYVSLFSTFAFTTEAHMFKPYRDRVLATRYFLRSVLQFMDLYGDQLREARDKALIATMQRKEFVVEWEPDTSRFDTLLFTGYTARHKQSQVTGLERLYYDRSTSWSKYIPYYNYYRPVKIVKAPAAYIVPQGWREVVERLAINGVQMKPLKKDTVLEVEVIIIESEETTPVPYNGHYWHYNPTCHTEIQQIAFNRGDLLVPVSQPAAAYIIQTLEPEGYDSFFSWNFFDPVLSRKEYFSPYIFEETAYELLQNDPELQKQFREKRESDSLFSANAYAQLRFIYEHSPYSEKSYRRYPVVRLENDHYKELLF